VRDNDRSKEQLLHELAGLRHRLAELEALQVQHERTEEALRTSETKYRALLTSASEGIIVVDMGGRITMANARAEEIFGYHQNELLGQPIEHLLPERLHEIHIGHRELYQAQPRSRPMGSGLDLNGRRKDGTELPLEIGLSFTEAGDEVHILTFITDITGRKQAEDAVKKTLAALEKRNRDLALLNQAGQTLAATLDLDRVVDQLLHAVTETIGAQASSVWLRDPDQPGGLICRAALNNGESHPLINVRLSPGQGIAGWVAQNGESLIVTHPSDDRRFSAEVDVQIGFHTSSLLAVPLQVRDAVIGVLEVVNKLESEFDADDRALAETLAASAAIALDNARLVEALRQQTQELQKSNQELDAFAHTVAHDLKGPVGLIVGFAQTLEESLAEIPHQELVQYLRTIARSGRKMNNIIKELLLMATVRKAQVDLEHVDTAGILSETTDRLAYRIEEYHAEIILPENWPVAMGYAPWLEEVWVNYIDNAIKYGGQPPRIELGAATQPDGSVRFWVRDNGPGITPEDQTRLFKPFTQIWAVRAQGHGLGLSIVQRIVEKLGGQVGVESLVGQGSTFFFTLLGPSQVKQT
jgi:PAS domain S-box-containing protein